MSTEIDAHSQVQIFTCLDDTLKAVRGRHETGRQRGNGAETVALSIEMRARYCTSCRCAKQRSCAAKPSLASVLLSQMPCQLLIPGSAQQVKCSRHIVQAT